MIAHGLSLRDPSPEERKASASDGTPHPPQRGTARRICEPSPFRSARAAPCCEAGRTRTLPRSRGGSSPLARPPAAGEGDGFAVQWVSHFRSNILPNAERDRLARRLRPADRHHLRRARRPSHFPLRGAIRTEPIRRSYL